MVTSCVRCKLWAKPRRRCACHSHRGRNRTPSRNPNRDRDRRPNPNPNPNPDQVRMCHGGLVEAARLVGECLRSEAAVDSDAARSPLTTHHSPFTLTLTPNLTLTLTLTLSRSESESESEQSNAEVTDCEANPKPKPKPKPSPSPNPTPNPNPNQDTDCEAALVACGFGPFGPLDSRDGASSSHHPALAAAPRSSGRSSYSLQSAVYSP